MHRDCNINVNLNQKIPIVFPNLKSCDSHVIVQELGKFKFNFKINVIPNRLEKKLILNSNNESIFVDFFKFLSSSLDKLKLRLR